MKFSRTTIYAMLMLLAYVPAVLLMSFHTHHAEGFANYQCEDCVHHKAHSGHLVTYSGHHLCLLCHFSHQSYMSGSACKSVVVPEMALRIVAPQFRSVVSADCNNLPTRGPPCF